MIRDTPICLAHLLASSKLAHTDDSHLVPDCVAADGQTQQDEAGRAEPGLDTLLLTCRWETPLSSPSYQAYIFTGIIACSSIRIMVFLASM